MFFRRFKFLDPGPLVDNELTLVAPSTRYLDEFLYAEQLSSTNNLDLPALRDRTEAFLLDCPQGHQRAQKLTGKVPSYHFWMRINPAHPSAPNLPIRIIGGLGLRIGQTPELELYSGHLGYHVYPPARGHRYAERAARLLLPLAKRHQISPLWITTNPDNFPSRKTCERLGATFIDIVDIPPNHPFQQRGETQKCRYKLTP